MLNFAESPRVWRNWLAALCLTLAVLCAGVVACKRSNADAKTGKDSPSLRLYVVSALAGAMEPCGCRKDMLGGVDHAATLVMNSEAKVPRLLFAAGATFFQDPELDPNKRTQDLWKAETIALALEELEITALTPGINDFAADTKQLSALQKQVGAPLVAANLKAPNTPIESVHVHEAGGFKVGVAGVLMTSESKLLAPSIKLSDAKKALQSALQQLKKQKSQINIALIAAERGTALRLLEAVPGFHVAVVGAALARGEGNDPPTAPIKVGNTLVIQPPNHLQGVAVVDLFVDGDEFEFQDGSGLERAERRNTLQRRIETLSARIDAWESGGKVATADLKARKADLAKLEAQLDKLNDVQRPESGSFFTYELLSVEEEIPSYPSVAKRMTNYYRKVNEHNRQLFKGKKPQPVPEGGAGYVGIEECSNCHDEAEAFWKTTPHSNAYATLADEHKQFNLDCVSCHVTGYEKPGGSTVTFVENLKDVQCETCHGPGSLHIDDPEKPGLISKTPDKSLCVGCHHPPHVVDDWDVEEAWKHIIGPGHGQPLKPETSKGEVKNDK